jgi:hypothetical protein
LPPCHVIRSGARGLQGERLDLNDLGNGVSSAAWSTGRNKTGITGPFDVVVAWAPDSSRAVNVLVIENVERPTDN